MGSTGIPLGPISTLKSEASPTTDPAWLVPGGSCPNDHPPIRHPSALRLFSAAGPFLTADRSGFSAMMLLCILIHEVGHLVGFALAGGEIRSVSPASIHIQRGRDLSSALGSLHPPNGSGVQFAPARPVLLLWGEQPVGAMFTAISGVLGIFHLLPIGNLDGAT